MARDPYNSGYIDGHAYGLAGESPTSVDNPYVSNEHQKRMWLEGFEDGIKAGGEELEAEREIISTPLRTRRHGRITETTVTVLAAHALWSAGGEGGAHADLRGADLRRADLRGAILNGAYLSDADLRGADLSGANLRSVDLRGAILRSADLRRADLRGAILRSANLNGADLSGADLNGAILRGAILRGADLSGAYLNGAILRDADLRGAILNGAILRGADLSGAYLSDADLRGADLPPFQLPEGDLIVWGKKGGRIVKMLIAADVKRTACLINRKCRAERAHVLDVEGADSVTSGRGGEYVKGQDILPDRYCDDIRVDCSHGIHFFQTRAEAEEWE